MKLLQEEKNLNKKMEKVLKGKLLKILENHRRKKKQ